MTADDPLDVLLRVPPPRVDTDERFTPRWLFDALGETFDLDPASPVEHETAVPAHRRYTRLDDGLTQEWAGFVWLNPPYSNATPWARRWLAHGNGLLLGPIANARWAQDVLRASALVWLMRDFPFDHPTHAGKRSSMPLLLAAAGDRGAAAIRRAALTLPEAGVVVRQDQ